MRWAAAVSTATKSFPLSASAAKASASAAPTDSITASTYDAHSAACSAVPCRLPAVPLCCHQPVRLMAV